MKKIYLASDSKARKKILDVLGLKFWVLKSNAKELKKTARISYGELVKKNAFLKAAEVATKVSSGVIIGADTIVVCQKQIFGKPKNLAAAKRMLMKLSGKSQWVYTGLAVIDKERNRKIVSFEKTKIYMDKLKRNEIDSYFRKVSPLDKAGSFDIQGRGAYFISRIEGCFYNVVGLPIRKLYIMLKKLGVSGLLNITLCVMGITLGVFLGGCSPEYNIVTGEQESYFYSTDKEVSMGQAIDRQVHKEYKMVSDPLVTKRVEDIGKRIAAVSDRKEIDYYFYVIDENEVNAVSLPGGYVYVFKGLIDKVDNDDELAGVLAHEVGHIVARHSIKKLQGAQAYSILRLLVAVAPSTGSVGAAADTAFTELMLGYSREDELLADQLGARYEKMAGYNPRAMVTFLQKLQEVNRKRPLSTPAYYKTHPYVPDRIRVVKEELGEGMNFKDYINIEQLPHPSR